METASTAVAAPAATTLSYLPVGLFGSVMGLTGLSVAWHLAHQHFGAPEWVSQGIGAGALLAFAALAIAYGVKAFSGFQAVKAEFRHPVAGNLFGTPMISLLLLPFLLAPVSLTLARLSWVLGAAGMTTLAWLIVLRWMTVRQATAHVTPAWIVPVVGMLDVPLAVPQLQWQGMHGVMVFGLAVGLFFAIPLFTMIFSRLAMEEALPPPLQPSLLIMVAPFSVGFTAYVTTTGSFDLFAEGLYMLMLFLLVVLLGRLRHLAQCSPFRVSWWAASFPLAASAGAALRYAGHEQSLFSDAVALVLLGVATVTILIFAVQTLRGIVNGQLKALA